MKSLSAGFTVIEMMVVVVIVGILLAIGIPNYKESAAKARRNEAITALVSISQNAERWYSNRFTYVNANAVAAGDASRFGEAQVPATGDAYYTIAYVGTATTYTITATRAGVQTGDGCGNFTLTSTGARSVAGNDAQHTRDLCWNR